MKSTCSTQMLKRFLQNSNQFHIENIQKEVEGNYINIINDIYEMSTANIILSNKQKSFLLKSRGR